MPQPPLSQDRVDRIAWNLERVLARIKADPNNPKVLDWQKRCDEYRQSLINIAEYGQEKRPTGNPSTNVNVPLGRFGLEGKV